MTPMIRRWTSLVAAVLVLSLARASPAQVATSEVARRLVGEGIEAARERDWLTARARFEKAYSIQPLPLTLYNLATAQEKTGQLVEADRSYRIFLRETSPGEHESFRSAAADRRGPLRRRIARITLRVPNIASNDVLRVGDKELAHAVVGQPIPANPGIVEVSLERRGSILASESVRLSEGASREVTLDVPVFLAAELPAPTSAAPGAAVAPAAAVTTVAAEQPKSGGVLSSPWFWIIAGSVVAVGTATGLYFGLRADDPFSSTIDPVRISGVP